MVAIRPDTDAPAWVNAVLASRATAMLARLALTLPYWWSGLDKLIHPSAALAEMHGLGFPASWWLLSLLLVVQLGGSLAIIANRYAWLGAALLAGFTAFVTVVAHAFWKQDGALRFAEMNVFMEHVALIAGLAFAALHAHATKNRRTWKESV
ncbi:MAG TPA: DoxX family protein [Dyella sp.]|nr:DoxX family protein [Dyella sp.]